MENYYQKRPVSRGRKHHNNNLTTQIFINDCTANNNYHIIAEKSEVSENEDSSPYIVEKINSKIEIKMKLMMNEVALMKKEFREFSSFKDRVVELERI